MEHTETNDSELALMTVLSAKIRASDGDMLVLELISSAAGRPAEGCHVDSAEAHALLQRHGLKLWPSATGCAPDYLLISNTHPQLKALLANTAYCGDLRGHLVRHKAIKKHDRTTSFSGLKSKALAVPLAEVLQTNEQENDDEQVGYDLGDVPF